MAKKGKKIREAEAKVEEKLYELEEALNKIKEISFVKFDETVDMAVKLGVDPRHADQMVRGSVVLPHGLGKSIKVLAFAKGEKEKEAQEAGADWVGAEDYVEKISKGWMEFDRVVATPDMMSLVSRVGKILGPRGLMPNAKSGTVSFDIGRLVREVKAGKVEYRVDKAGIIHVPLGKRSFPTHSLYENATTILDALVRAKPASSKGQYLKGISIASTMGPGIKIDHVQAANAIK